MSVPSDVARPAPASAPGTAHRWASARVIVALILREMSTRYGKSPGGYAWAILEPLGAITILSFGFSLMLRSPSLGNSFLLFYASGYLPFNLYQTLSLTLARSISFSRPLLMYPVVTWTDAILARLILNLLTGLLVAYILITAIMAITDTRTVLDIGPMIGSMALAALMGLGIGALNCALGGLYPTYDIIWSIATRPLFIISGILFVYEDLPRSVQQILWYNPLIHVTGKMRAGVFSNYDASYVSNTYVLVVSLVCLFLGLLLLGRYHRDILNR